MATTLSLLRLPILSQKQPHHSHSHSHSRSKLSCSTKLLNVPKESNIPQKLFQETIHHLTSAALPLTTVTLPFFLDTKDALAVNGEFGILEGRSFALIHPIVMGSLFLYTLWAGYLGWQWRRVRTIQNEITELKKQVTPTPVTPEGTPVEAAPSPVETKIQQLTEERKELLKGSYRDRHFNAGSLLLGFGVFEAIGGGVNTWFRTGKLFPGPHLFAGAAITVLWAAAAALVPAMQKGNETARNLHIALNALNVLLFIWQIPTGIDIVFKVFEFTKWP
ncbi:Plant/F21F14-40 protein [Melia azedarach]|uniref:Plant/F21F14-40 protein n=1 Tax=Melia azedarach TaxID=155640 RepID=A0ACC1YWK8_MELAZ|nr:Plant/F21F14-40 protein [Melia azedarach]